MCTACGYEVTIAETGEEALAVMKDAKHGARFALVLCDVHLPGASPRLPVSPRAIPPPSACTDVYRRRSPPNPP